MTLLPNTTLSMTWEYVWYEFQRSACHADCIYLAGDQVDYILSINWFFTFDFSVRIRLIDYSQWPDGLVDLFQNLCHSILGTDFRRLKNCLSGKTLYRKPPSFNSIYLWTIRLIPGLRIFLYSQTTETETVMEDLKLKYMSFNVTTLYVKIWIFFKINVLFYQWFSRDTKIPINSIVHP